MRLTDSANLYKMNKLTHRTRHCRTCPLFPTGIQIEAGLPDIRSLERRTTLPRDRFEPRKYRALTNKDIDRIPQLRQLDPDELDAMKAVAAVLPFRVNSYVLDELIDWKNIPEDPIYQLTFPQEDMLAPLDFARMLKLIRSDAPELTRRSAARKIRVGRRVLLKQGDPVVLTAGTPVGEAGSTNTVTVRAVPPA